MNNSRQWILAAIGFLALSLWVGAASADGPVESTTGSSTLEGYAVGSSASIDPEDEIDAGGAPGSGLPAGPIRCPTTSVST